MQNLNTILIAVIAGLVSAGLMGTSHYICKPLKLHPVIRYSIGSFSCLVAFSVAIFSLKEWEPEGIVWVAWVVWVLTGLFTAFTYWWDWRIARGRGARVDREINDFNTRRKGHR